MRNFLRSTVSENKRNAFQELYVLEYSPKQLLSVRGLNAIAHQRTRVKEIARPFSKKGVSRDASAYVMIASVMPKPRKEQQVPGSSGRNAANAAKVSMNLVERRRPSIAQVCQLANALKEHKAKVLVKLRGEGQLKSFGEIIDQKEAVGRKRLDHCKRYFCERYFGLHSAYRQPRFSVSIHSSLVMHAPAACLIFGLP